jgi:hypothetical protein
VPLLLALLHDDLPEVQAQALHSLIMVAQAIPLQHTLARVYPLLEHPDLQVSKAAQSAIDAIGS